MPARAGSWVEWLYFNGQAGSTRFYLTFLVGPVRENGRRMAGVRLQLDRAGQVENYGESAEVDADEVLATAPEITIGRTASASTAIATSCRSISGLMAPSALEGQRGS